MTKWTLIQVCGRGRREGKVKIIIVGAGKVGETLAADLSREGNDITVIDKVDSVVDHVCDRYDIMGFAGNGASYSVLMDADTGAILYSLDRDVQRIPASITKIMTSKM